MSFWPLWKVRSDYCPDTIIEVILSVFGGTSRTSRRSGHPPRSAAFGIQSISMVVRGHWSRTDKERLLCGTCSNASNILPVVPLPSGASESKVLTQRNRRCLRPTGNASATRFEQHRLETEPSQKQQIWTTSDVVPPSFPRCIWTLRAACLKCKFWGSLVFRTPSCY